MLPDVPTSALAAVEILQSPAALFTDGGEIAYLNSAWRTHAGLTDSTRQPMSWSALLHPDDQPAALARFQAAVASGQGIDFECRLPGISGLAPWFMLGLQPISEDRPAGRHWLCTSADIHALKLREDNLQTRASLQEDMLNISVDCIKLIALDGTLVHMNKAGCRALVVPETSSFGMPWLPLLPDDVRGKGEMALAAARSGKFARFPGRSVLPDNKVQYWDNMLSPVMDSAGLTSAILCVSREVTGEREALDRLQSSQERLEIAARVGGLGIWDYDIERDALNCDDAWHHIMGRDPENPVRSISEFQPIIHPEDVDRATEIKHTAAELIAAKRDYSIIFRIVRPSGDIRWVRSAACMFEDMAGTPKRAVGFVVDITDAWRGELALRDANRTLEAEKTSLARQSLEDPLTGIANRRHLDSELARICIHASETGEAVSIGMVDVDHFKAYNDQYGHLEGDTALRKIASALQTVARQSDFVARYGGEEFAFVLTGIGDPAPVLDRFNTSIAELAIAHRGSPTGYLTISCGCVVFQSRQKLSPTMLLKASDDALYEAKMAGRNRHVIRAATL